MIKEIQDHLPPEEEEKENGRRAAWVKKVRDHGITSEEISDEDLLTIDHNLDQDSSEMFDGLPEIPNEKKNRIRTVILKIEGED